MMLEIASGNVMTTTGGWLLTPRSGMGSHGVCEGLGVGSPGDWWVACVIQDISTQRALERMYRERLLLFSLAVLLRR